MRRGSISTFDPFLLETKVKVRMRKRITAHAHLKRGRISREIQKSIARAAWRFLRKKRSHAILRYAENRSIPFSRRFARVTLTHVTGPLRPLSNVCVHSVCNIVLLTAFKQLANQFTHTCQSSATCILTLLSPHMHTHMCTHTHTHTLSIFPQHVSHFTQVECIAISDKNLYVGTADGLVLILQ